MNSWRRGGRYFCAEYVITVTLEGLISLFLKAIKVDPALGASPILTTLTDMCGFTLILGLARLAMGARLV